ncbi:beta-glucosidase B [Aspergillus caelatus]|uniref:beta-glucosidase n=1 Tax=Aspergillus caelatus TaxID=61420 RepID=A0A5N7ABP0_9EURO|nr:beta-glucosidase B [Aspergillus caelatus]KAE8367274.1 beta-glucosidase B [Aspergillus caelatus]
MAFKNVEPGKIENLLATLTLEEKITLLAGKDFWQTVDLPEKGVPSVKTSDGPNGARGAAFKGGTTSACFPASCLLAATWDRQAVRKIGRALADETRSKGARVLLAPTVCPHRHPLGGRNFESFSEDPFLAGKMAAQYIHGLQDNGVAATIKHYAVNEQETCRFTVNEIVGERALREIYLKPFEIAIKEANPLAVMTAYNLVNGTHADSHKFLLQDVLRGQWGWDGLVMSDWGGTNSTADSLNAGLDLEMPGPPRWRKVEDVVAAVESGAVSHKTIDDHARRILELLTKLNCFEDPTIPEERAINLPEHQRLIRSVGSQGVVLLKNDAAVLPLKKERLANKKIALLGFAREGLIHGGGSASVNAHYRVTPEEGLRAALGDTVEFDFAKGANTFRQLPLLGEDVVGLGGKPGWTLEFFNEEEPTGKPASTSDSALPTYIPIFVKEKWGSLRATARFTPSHSGNHYFGMSGLGPSKVMIDGKLLYDQRDNCPDSMAFLLGGVEEPEVQFSFEAGTTYTIEVITVKPSSKSGLAMLDGLIGFRLGFMTEQEHDRDLLSEAVEVAKSSDIAIIFTGHTPDWETEGQDQKSFHLPSNGSQDRLVEAVGAANPNTIVVNSTGVAIAMPWLGKVKAVVQAWFPGQEAGNTIADILVGAANPSGRLPMSFPHRVEDAPAHGNFPGEYVENDGNRQLQVQYAEGVFVGYRHYDRSEENRGKVLFPFGYGLSYTTFAHANHKVDVTSDGTVQVSMDVTNTGSYAGDDVVQVYAGSKEVVPENPVKELVGFVKVHLEPGETKTTSIDFDIYQLAHFSEQSGKWELQAGDYQVSTGKSVTDITAQAIITLGPELCRMLEEKTRDARVGTKL